VSAPDFSDADDAELVVRACDGQVRAFEALLERHQSRVIRVLRLLGVPAQDREDVAQEVFIRVFRHLGTFRRGQAFAPWLYRVTVNASHDYRTRRGRLARGEVPWDESVDSPAGGGEDPAEAVRQRELRRALEEALERLTERERAVFVLRELEGLSSADVARSLGISSITVRRHLALARRRLRTGLGGIEKDRMAIERLAPDGGSQ
jgi:RNA polymerase sigma-70 factor (ECF subfamily)